MPKEEVKRRIRDFLDKLWDFLDKPRNLWPALEPAVKERPRDVGVLAIGIVFGTVTGIIGNVALLATIHLLPEINKGWWGLLAGGSWGALIAWCTAFWYYGRKLLRGEAI